MNQLDMSLVVLCVLLACGIVIHNNTIWLTASLLILVKVLPIQHHIFPYIQQYGLNLGILTYLYTIQSIYASYKLGKLYEKKLN